MTLLDEVVDTLRQGKKLDEKYRDHALGGNFVTKKADISAM